MQLQSFPFFVCVPRGKYFKQNVTWEKDWRAEKVASGAVVVVLVVVVIWRSSVSLLLVQTS